MVVVGLFRKKAYKESAMLLIKNGVGGNVVGLTAFLSWYGVTCIGK